MGRGIVYLLAEPYPQALDPLGSTAFPGSLFSQCASDSDGLKSGNVLNSGCTRL